jgi:hypothetical protein
MRMPGSDRVKPASPGVKLTYDDFLLFPDDGQRPELIDSWLEIHQVGRVFYAPYDVVFSNFDVVEPDLLYLSSEADDSLTTPLLPGLEMPLRRIFRE